MDSLRNIFATLFQHSLKRTLYVIAGLAVAVSLPITLALTQQQQDLRQRAALLGCPVDLVKVTQTSACNPNYTCGSNQGNCDTGLYCKTTDAYGTPIPNGSGICCPAGKYFCPSTSTCTYQDSCPAGGTNTAPTASLPTESPTATPPPPVSGPEADKNIAISSVFKDPKDYVVYSTTTNTQKYNVALKNLGTSLWTGTIRLVGFRDWKVPYTDASNAIVQKTDLQGVLTELVGLYSSHGATAFDISYPNTNIPAGDTITLSIPQSGTWNFNFDPPNLERRLIVLMTANGTYRGGSSGGANYAASYYPSGPTPTLSPSPTNTPTPTATPVPPAATATTAPGAATATTTPLSCDPFSVTGQVPGTIDQNDLNMARIEVLGYATTHLASCMTTPDTDATTGEDVLRIRLRMPNP